MADAFLEHRKKQEEEHLKRIAGDRDPMNSLITVEFNVTELCNRKCVFCPRVDPKVYPNRSLHMKKETTAKVASDLASFSYRGRISFSGFGEPFLHKEFAALVRICRIYLPESTIETNTNGDFLTVEKIQEIFDAGLTYLYINLYDGVEQRQVFHNLLASAGIDPSRYRLRDHWMGSTQAFGLNLNNRSGMVTMEGMRSPVEVYGKPCFYPFYKMLVDWDGNVLFCSNDWGREIVVGNVHKQHVKDIWMSEDMYRVRGRLMRGDRSVSPCSTCNVEGTLHGRSSFDLLTRYYKDLPKTDRM